MSAPFTLRTAACAIAIACVVGTSERAHAREKDAPQPDTWTPFTQSKLVPPVVLGVRAADTSTRAGDSTQGLSAFVYMAGYSPMVRLTATMRAGRSFGADGKLAVDLALGPSYELFERGFLFARFGARGQLEGNELFTVNEVEPLQAQAGLEIVTAVERTPILFELAGRGSLATGAHVSVGDFTRNFKPAPAWGGHLALSVGPVRVEAVFTEIAPTGRSRAALDLAEVVACARAGSVTLCLDHSDTFTGLFGSGTYYREDISMTGFTLGTTL